MIISLEQIRTILFSHILKGQTLNVLDIKNLVITHHNFSQADLSPYGNRKSYKTWEHQVAEALFHLKRKGIITHNKSQHTYTF
ncbi:TPA: hypothetical protein LA460_000141 [Clostridium botulinum]|nr:hypothetical protein [Clostridium botulinum]HBJ1652746.1 hypothetical protein [Clostridium botulinum]